MTAPRLEIDLDKIHDNASLLVRRLADRGVSVTGVTKAILGSPEIAKMFLRAGVSGIGDSRIENMELIRRADIPASMTLVRSPMLSDLRRVVTLADASLNTEKDVIQGLSRAGREMQRAHGVVLMVELGDLREGIMPADIEDAVGETLRLPNISFKGIGANLACRSGVAPDAQKMSQLSSLADSIETTFGITIELVTGGNSANLQWALSGANVERINDLRLGESILLGCEPLHRKPIDGLHTDAFSLTAEVIESKSKPSLPWGDFAQSAFGDRPPTVDRGRVQQSILAIGRQDADPDGLQPPPGVEILAASSDHLILESRARGVAVGDEMTFQLNYSALVRAMTSPFVAKFLNVGGVAVRS